jgi:hypothetical protein
MHHLLLLPPRKNSLGSPSLTLWKKIRIGGLIKELNSYLGKLKIKTNIVFITSRATSACNTTPLTTELDARESPQETPLAAKKDQNQNKTQQNKTKPRGLQPARELGLRGNEGSFPYKENVKI